MKTEQEIAIVKKAREEFVKELIALNGGNRIAFAANVMPRETWARCLAIAFVTAGIIPAESADNVLAALDSDLGNSSQLGTLLLKEKLLVREEVGQAAKTLAELLAERAKAKQA